jgi:hypothetical protein
MTPRATTTVAPSMGGPDTGTTRAPRIAKYCGSPPCAHAKPAANSSNETVIVTMSAEKPMRSNNERMLTPYEQERKIHPLRAVEWTDEATVKFHVRQAGRELIR